MRFFWAPSRSNPWGGTAQSTSPKIADPGITRIWYALSTCYSRPSGLDQSLADTPMSGHNVVKTPAGRFQGGSRRPERNRGNDDERLRKRSLVGDCHIDPRLVPCRRDRLEPLERAPGEFHRRTPRRQIDHPHITPEHPSP